MDHRAPAVHRRHAIGALTLACACWGVGFPVMKALASRAQILSPGIDTWFVAALTLWGRFAAGVALLVAMRPVKPRPAEWRQGLWLGIVTGVGMLLQVDGMAYTEASTSAFLTQGYVVLLPVFVWIVHRRRPSRAVVGCASLVLIGLAILSEFDPRTLELGRGEAETLLAATCFAVQIMLLDQERYAHNRTGPVTNVMFGTIALLALPAALLLGRGRDDFAATLGNSVSFVLLLTLLVFSTLGAFVLMNRFQRGVSASEAGVIYCMEPVFASLFALFLPGVLSNHTGIEYANETLDPKLLLGGGLVVVATIALALLARRRPRASASLGELGERGA